MADFTRIGNTLNQLRNPVLRRRMFQPSREDLRALSRSPVGIQASSPELINAVATNQVTGNPFGARARHVSTIPDLMSEDTVPAPAVVAPRSTVVGGGMPDEMSGDVITGGAGPTPVAPAAPAAPAAPSSTAPSSATDTPSSLKPKVPSAENKADDKKDDKKDPDKKPTKNKADLALDEFTAKLAALRGGKQAKSKKDRLKDAKEFLKEAGVSDVDDIRTSKDFMLMTLGLNIAAGQSGDFLTNVAGGAKETLGTYGELKAKEREAERAVNLAAAEMAKADYDAEIARGAKLDEAELAMLTERYKQSLGPDKLQIAQALVDESDGKLSLADALAMTGKTTQTKFGEYLSALKSAYKNANIGFLANIAGSSAFLKGFIDQYGMEGLSAALGQTATPQDVSVLQGAAGSAAENKGDQSGGSGITIEPIE